ncbi:MAG: MBL fold metallo-hydrolase [Gammaproteobacteria bacterium]|nr:MBL fold metallo-hydrolase [Gammaproteobacteria bacterium]
MNNKVTPFFHQDSNTFSYIVECLTTRHCAIIDPCADFDLFSGKLTFNSAEQILDFVTKNNLICDYILETHAHADHLSAAFWLKQKTNAKIGIGEGILEVQKTFSSIFSLNDELQCDGSQFDCLWKDGQSFLVGELVFHVLSTPGHTSDSVSYQVDEYTFVGDTLFVPARGTARCDFPGGSAEKLFDSVQKLFQLPDSTKLMLCHDYPEEGQTAVFETTVAEHKLENIHINKDTSVEDFVAKRQKRDETLSVPKLLYPSVQVNIRAGELPAANKAGQIYLKIPVNRRN